MLGVDKVQNTKKYVILWGKANRAEAEERVVRETASLCDVKMKLESIGKHHNVRTYNSNEKGQCKYV